MKKVKKKTYRHYMVQVILCGVVVPLLCGLAGWLVPMSWSNGFTSGICFGLMPGGIYIAFIMRRDRQHQLECEELRKVIFTEYNNIQKLDEEMRQEHALMQEREQVDE